MYCELSYAQLVSLCVSLAVFKGYYEPDSYDQFELKFILHDGNNRLWRIECSSEDVLSTLFAFSASTG